MTCESHLIVWKEPLASLNVLEFIFFKLTVDQVTLSAALQGFLLLFIFNVYIIYFLYTYNSASPLLSAQLPAAEESKQALIPLYGTKLAPSC